MRQAVLDVELYPKEEEEVDVCLLMSSLYPNAVGETESTRGYIFF
jgi:hypothetical protein